MDRRIAFLPGSVAAALTSAALTLLFALYMPSGAIIDPFIGHAPDVTQGKPFFGKPRTTVVSIHRDGMHRVGTTAVPLAALPDQLRKAHAAEPTLPLEIEADRRLPTAAVFRVLAAAQQAGYTEAYVFGHEHSLLEIASLQPQ